MLKYILTLVFLLNTIGVVKLLQYDLQVGYFKPPKHINSLILNDTFINNGVVQQKVDHFSNDNKTWQMRYYSNAEYYDGTGPMFIFIGGHINIDALIPLLFSGLMHSMALESNGYMFLIEHRYFGESLPVQFFQTSKMRFLTINQSLEDIYNFILTKKDQITSLKNSKVVLVGAGHGAALASWMKMKYPHIIDAVVSDSGIVKAEMEAFDFIKTGLLAFRDTECREELQNNLFSILDYLQSAEGQTQLDKDFTFCSTINFTNSLDNQAIFFQMIEILTHDILNGSKSLLKDCKQMKSRVSLPDYDLFVRFVESKKICLKNYKELISIYQALTPSFDTDLRSLLYQKCTQLGGFILLSENIDILNVDFYYKLCSDVFGNKFTTPFINSSINATNIVYGGLEGNFTNVVVIKGCLDPYSHLMIGKPDYLRPVFVINGTSHQGEVVDISKKTDTYKLKSTRKCIRKIIQSWIIA